MSTITYGSVCSGIEAATVAWHSMGWQAAWLAEIEPAPSAVLAHHYPDVPNLGDMTKIAEMVRAGTVAAPDVLVGGTPCQAFSIAGLRNSLDDARGQLSLSFVDLANAIDAARIIRGEPAATILWESVPGVLSTADNAFGCFLGALAGEDEPVVPAGKKWTNAGCVFGPQRAVAWRVIDAQYFGVAQRRRRVFVVASARDGFDPAAVLFERGGLRRDIAPSRGEGESAAAGVTRCAAGGGDAGGAEADGGVICMAHGQGGAEVASERRTALTCNHEAPILAYGIPGNWIGRKPENGGNAVEPMHNIAPCLTGTDRHGVAAYSVTLRGREGGATAELGGNVAGTLRASGGGGDKAHVLAPVIAFSAGDHGNDCGRDITPTLRKGGDGGGNQPAALIGTAVRRLTPKECARLQGFPDAYLSSVLRNGKPLADGPMYKAFGNSMAVPCMAFIGRRINNAIAEAA